MNSDLSAKLASTGLLRRPKLRVHQPQTARARGDFRQLEQLAYRYGRHYDSYIATDTEGKEYFWTSEGDGAVCLVLRGRYAFVFGGLLAAPSQWRKLLSQLMEECQRKGRAVLFFNVSDDELPLLREFGFQVTKFGEEPIIDLEQCTWRGKEYEWIRRQTNYCRRNGIVFEEIRRDRSTHDEWNQLMSELEVISQHFLEDKANDEGIRNVISRFSPELIFRQRLFVARNPARQRVEAFIMCNPCRDGQLWAIESYRRRHDATRGVIPFLMHQAMQRFKEEGVPRVSMSMLPFVRCNESVTGDSWLARRMICLSYRFLNSIYDAPGLYHFKSRFRPHYYENRYVCAPTTGALDDRRRPQRLGNSTDQRIDGSAKVFETGIASINTIDSSQAKRKGCLAKCHLGQKCHSDQAWIRAGLDLD